MFNILRNADIRNDTSCRHDNNVGWSVSWEENEDFKSYTETSGIISRLVWDRNYVFATTSGTCYLGPSTDQVPFDASQYSKLKINLRIEPSQTVTIPTTAKVQFQTSSDPTYDSNKEVQFPIAVTNSYDEYIVDMSEIREWAGNITRLRLFPFIDGTEGYVVHLKSIEAVSVNVFSCDTIHKSSLCDKYYEYSHPCPWVGSGGHCQSGAVDSGITIQEGVNDRLVVDINGYGSHAVTLNPVVQARLEEVARDIENKLSNVSIAGYFGNKVEVTNRKIKIIADDTREDSSTVVVLDTPAARTLGFYDQYGSPTFSESAGENAASQYITAGTVQLSKAQLASFYSEDQSEYSGISMDVNRYSIRGGRADYASGFSDRKLDFTGKTLIDFNNPISSTGIITSVAYFGDGEPTTEFRIFRPSSDGGLLHIYSIPMDIPAGSEDSNFEAVINLKVRKGDLLGIYDGKISRGKTQELPNGSYMLFEGDLKDGISIAGPKPSEGRGHRGLRLFAHGEDKESSAVVDIQFEQLELVETLTVNAKEEERVEEINLTKAKVGGINGGVYITATTGLDKFGAQAPGFTNLGALIDGVKHTSPTSTDAYPVWLDGTISPTDLYDQTPFSIAMDFAKGTKVFFDINRIVLSFTDTFNIKYFSVEYPITTNDEDTLQNWGPVGSKYTEVKVEGKVLSPDTHPLYENPTHPTVENFIESYQSIEYNTLDLSFTPVRARSLRYVVDNAYFEDETYKSTLSNYQLAPSPRILEIEVYAQSKPRASIADNFSFQSSQDGLNYVLHTNITETGSTTADYLIGYPVKNIRATFKPQGKMDINSLTATVSIGNTSVHSEHVDGTVSLNAAKNDFSSYQVFKATNDSLYQSNYYVGISPQRGEIDRCILWNKLSSNSTTSVSELGPSPTVYKRDPYYLREYNYSYNMPGYVLDPVWLMNSNAVSYISYDSAGTWEPLGNVLTDYNEETSVTSVSPQFGSHDFVYIIIDLGKVYALETLQVFNSLGDFTGPSFCGIDTDSPYDLNIISDFEGSQSAARWVRFSAFANTATDENIKDISYVDISLDAASKRNIGKLTWALAPKLTDYSTTNLSPNINGEGWAAAYLNFTNWYAIDLESHRDITNIITGPNYDNLLVGDFDTLLPGGTASRYSSSSKVNDKIAYSSSNVDDVSKVQWRNLGDAPTSAERWILIKAPDEVVDEVIVHVDNNVQKDKVPFASTRWWTSDISSVYKDTLETIENEYSISVDYPSSLGPSVETIELNQSLGIDHLLARRDNFRLLIYISDVSQLDTSIGSIKLGRSNTEVQQTTSPWNNVEKDVINYFEWPISSIASLLESGWNEIYLPFSGNFKVGQPYFTDDNFSRWSYDSPSGKSRFKWLSMSFAGVVNNKKISVKLAGPEIVRGTYTPGKFGDALYLTGPEYAKFPLDNFNTLEGTIEFYLNPEWSKDPLCNTCEDPRDHTIFRAFNDDGFSISLFMTGKGLRVYLTNGDKHYFLTDNSNVPIILGENNHISVTWDLLGNKGEHALKVYIDGVVSMTMDRELIVEAFKPNTSCVLMFGGVAWDGLVSNKASSVDGSIENLKVFNYAKSEFSHSLDKQGLEYSRPSEELIEISTDGVNFFGSGDRGYGLPILVKDVAPGESFDVYVRNRYNFTKAQASDKNRKSYIEIVRSTT